MHKNKTKAELILHISAIEAKMKLLLASHADFIECAENEVLGTPDIAWAKEIHANAEQELWP